MSGFVVIVLSFIWLLQTQFMTPYYRQARISSANSIVDTIEKALLKQNDYSQDSFDIATVKNYLQSNNTCGYFTNQSVNKAYIFNDTEPSCYAGFTSSDLLLYSSKAGDSPSLKYSETYVTKSGQSRYLLVEKMNTSSLDNQEGDYYIIISMALDIPNTTIQIFRSQFLWIAAIVVAAAIVLALFIARRMSRPVVEMKNKATLLAKGDYTVRFNHGGYSELSELADTLNFATEEMERTEELRRDLIANVSHDIKTPLTMIKAYAEMIQDISGNNPLKREEHLQVIVKETNYLTSLVNDMLEISKYQSNTLIINEANFNLTKLVNDLADLVRENDEQVSIDIECPPDLVAYGDEIKIGQVISNYLGNAIKHHGDDQSVIIRVLAKGNHYRIEVEDHGSGIAAEDVKSIWDRYFKIDKNYQRTTTGTGLGLSIVKSICESAHYDYGVDSVLNRGSIFYVTLKKGKKG